ncbi:DUF4097 family beta strand repeat-containing protein [Micromonospora sp. CPCC 206061]|uniref:DUF4097 family beta strand repeat-containing protein n=1 Tax=Micromonospora sp. CPCC 206061 TaxID=3122410 RepID=UPI002FF169CC
MLRTLSTLGLAGVTLLAAAACGVADIDTSAEEDRYGVPGTVTALDVRANAGSVTIVATDGPVQVRETRRYSDEPPRTSHRTEGGTLYLVDDGCDGKRRFNFKCETDYRVEVPAGVTVALKADASEVTITGITGALDIATDVGAIKGTGLAGKTKAYTNVGDVDLRFATVPASVDTSNDVGSTAVYLPSTGSYRFDVDVELGDQNIDLPTSPDARTLVTMRGNVGDVSVRAA